MSPPNPSPDAPENKSFLQKLRKLTLEERLLWLTASVLWVAFVFFASRVYGTTIRDLVFVGIIGMFVVPIPAVLIWFGAFLLVSEVIPKIRANPLSILRSGLKFMIYMLGSLLILVALYPLFPILENIFAFIFGIGFFAFVVWLLGLWAWELAWPGVGHSRKVAGVKTALWVTYFLFAFFINLPDYRPHIGFPGYGLWLSWEVRQWAIWAFSYGLIGCFFYAWMKYQQEQIFRKHFVMALVVNVFIVTVLALGFLNR